MGFLSKLSGWDYFFRDQPEANSQATAQRMTLVQFQTYPQNEVEGRGTMVTQNGVTAGKYWNVVQPPQIDASDRSLVTENLLAGGTLTNGIYGTPLLDNPSNNSGMS
jgi:hypothetical protein